MGGRARRLKTPKAAVAAYWLGTPEGRERLGQKALGLDWYEPACFACGKWVPDPLDAPVTWSAWNRAPFERCHLVPRTLGGLDTPQNLVLLCAQCHLDAPDVADPGYMLRWIDARQSWWNRGARAIQDAVGREGLADDLEQLSHDDADRAFEIFQELLASGWVALHGNHVTDQTTGAAAAEVLRRLRDERLRAPS